MSQTPYAAVYTVKDAAEAAANVRNALLVTVFPDGRIDVVDYYRRNEKGEPMPAEWRDLVGQIHVPWLQRPKGG